MRRPRSFWEARVAELARGRSVESLARQHDVRPGRLRWWRWRLGSLPSTALVPVARPTRMIEIVPARPPSAGSGLRMIAGDIVLEVPAATPPEYVGRVLGAARSAC